MNISSICIINCVLNENIILINYSSKYFHSDAISNGRLNLYWELFFISLIDPKLKLSIIYRLWKISFYYIKFIKLFEMYSGKICIIGNNPKLTLEKI